MTEHVLSAGERLLAPATAVDRRRGLADRFWKLLSLVATIVVIAPLVAIIYFVVVRGLPTLTPDLVFNAAGNTTKPGALNAIVGSLQMVPLALLIGGGLGMAAGIYMAEFAGPRLVAIGAFVVDVLLGVPSIIAGLLIYGTVVTYVTGSSALAGSLALAVIIFPIVMRSTEEVLRLVPEAVREASLALGIPKWRTTISVVLPVARAGLLTGLMLAFARGFGETAPLLFTARGSNALNIGDFSSPMSALPLFVYQNSRLASDFFVGQAWSAAIVLLVVVLFINVVVRGRSIGTRVE
jgi:phosphate transport system permease protein